MWSSRQRDWCFADDGAGVSAADVAASAAAAASAAVAADATAVIAAGTAGTTGAVAAAAVTGADAGAAVGASVVIIGVAPVAVGMAVIGAVATATAMRSVTVSFVNAWALPGFRIGSRQLCLQGQRLLSLLVTVCCLIVTANFCRAHSLGVPFLGCSWV